MLWLVAIDVVVLLFFKKGIADSFKREVNVYVSLYSKGVLKSLPSYIKVLPPKSGKFVPYKAKNGINVYVDVEKVRYFLNKFVWTLIAWEIALAMSVVMVLVSFLKRFNDKKRKMYEMLKYILIATSHKLGNFVAVQKVNLALIDNRSEAAERLSRSMDNIEKDFAFLTSLLENLGSEGLKESVNVCSEIESVLKEFDFKELSVSFSCREGMVVRVDVNDFRIFMTEILNNAFKYADSYIDISVKRKSTRVVIVIENDFSHKSSSSGVGMIILEYIAKKNGWLFTRRYEGKVFKIIVVLM